MSVNWADFKPIADANAPATSEGLPASIGEKKPISDASPTLADYAKGPLPGQSTGIRSRLSGQRSGATNVGKYIRDIGDTGQRYWSDSMTPAGRRAAESQVFEDDPAVIPSLGSVHYRPWPRGLPSLPRRCLLRPCLEESLRPDCAAWPGWQLLEESAGRLLRLPLAQPRQLADGGELRRQSGRQGPVSAGIRRSIGRLQAHRTPRNGSPTSSKSRWMAEDAWVRCD